MPAFSCHAKFKTFIRFNTSNQMPRMVISQSPGYLIIFGQTHPPFFKKFKSKTTNARRDTPMAAKDKNLKNFNGDLLRQAP